MLNKNEILLFEKHLTFWNKLTDKQKDSFINHTSVVRYQKDSSIHTADLDCVGLMLPKSGTLRVYILSEEGREVTLYRIRSGSVCILSAACVLQSITFDVSIDAVTDCELLQVDSAAFLSLMQENIYVEAFAYKKATERFSDAMWAMQQILFMSFDKRLALFLLDETSKTGTLSLRMTHEEIAKYMGSAREVVSRMLKYFSSEGLVRLSRGEILITDRKKLTTLV
ncbi:CRP/FNR family transcriptional regulator [Kineothrix alysoides]|uniref:CRP/FNR family transcriptional regulator n=1 Tax=Kineothrix alysoides TaxID=1469948 RepID=A0A4R1R4S9_9FIRM|nr:Crp/Fnr family transcriptional regulator [Kineothrix alysoides]TCL60493.1 CRP/FNR family transcriptional regulator [Kineothrix alysoides]